MPLVDTIAIAAYLTVKPALVRTWAARYPAELPRRAIDLQGRTMYELEDAEKLAARLGYLPPG